VLQCWDETFQAQAENPLSTASDNEDERWDQRPFCFKFLGLQFLKESFLSALQ
jgi:hypothetical protein